MTGQSFDGRGELDPWDPRLDPAIGAIGRAVADVMEQIANHELRYEEPITERLAQAIESEFRHLEPTDGVEWSVRLPALSKREERRHGADLAVVSDLDLGDYRARKGFVLQFKRADRLGAELGALRQQSAKMLEHTPAAAVAIVDPPDGVLVLPAGDHESPDFPDRARAIPLEEAFRRHFACVFGDPELDDVQAVLRRLEPERLLEVRAARRPW
jgi:hypothetical protein